MGEVEVGRIIFKYSLGYRDDLSLKGGMGRRRQQEQREWWYQSLEVLFLLLMFFHSFQVQLGHCTRLTLVSWQSLLFIRVLLILEHTLEYSEG